LSAALRVVFLADVFLCFILLGFTLVDLTPTPVRPGPGFKITRPSAANEVLGASRKAINRFNMATNFGGNQTNTQQATLVVDGESAILHTGSELRTFIKAALLA